MTDDLSSPADLQSHPKPSKKKGFALAPLAFALAVMVPIFVLLTMMATHLGFIATDLGFRVLTLGLAPRLAMGTLVIAGLSVLISLFLAPKRYGPWALAAVIVSGATLGAYTLYHRQLKAFPPVADVATNWSPAVTLSDKLIEARGADAKVVEDLPRVPRNESMEWGGKTIPAINDATCPGARTIHRKDISSDQVADMFKSDKSYSVFGTAPWRIEATHQDNFFGFKADVVVRLDPTGIDVRSISRYDMPDLGDNCRRVTEIVNKIRALPSDPDMQDPPAESVASASMADESAPPGSAPGGTAGGDAGGD